jgi:Tfp pilus assembly protein FimT
MITLLIVGVVLTFGMPNLTAFTQNSRITTTANDLHAAFQLARSEAARTKSNITICASNNSMAAAADCQGNWEDGFIVFVDANGDVARAGANETVVRAHPDAFCCYTTWPRNDFARLHNGEQRPHPNGSDLPLVALLNIRKRSDTHIQKSRTAETTWILVG